MLVITGNKTEYYCQAQYVDCNIGFCAPYQIHIFLIIYKYK